VRVASERSFGKPATVTARALLDRDVALAHLA
jgi:hypothetical protein